MDRFTALHQTQGQQHAACVTVRCAEMREFALYPSYLSIISGTGFYRVKYAHSRYFVVSIIMNEKYLDAGLDWAELGLVFG